MGITHGVSSITPKYKLGQKVISLMFDGKGVIKKITIQENAILYTVKTGIFSSMVLIEQFIEREDNRDYVVVYSDDGEDFCAQTKLKTSSLDSARARARDQFSGRKPRIARLVFIDE